MKSIHALVGGAALCGVCSLAVAQAKPDGMCAVIDSFAEGIAVGEKRSLELETKYAAGSIVPSKSCKPSTMDAKGRAVCEWMAMHTSSEFMGHNISRVIACVTKGTQLIRKDVSVNSMSGDFTVHGQQADIQVEYQFNSRYDKRQFVAIRITAAEPEEE
ncbi:hypothetical protein INH39_17760 [Massilia violaceinigra]|uniref:DUF3617 domain-containing protein n=1 Tax=Massilia violaceinigra TaxID=2045208 RepID=A0ABY3ZY45_9BURK|nr:hypothetical protein [Massilia violaceinigra]UOD27379.1 hypothetical protein INH39_17760 [Massilia violaceinigra]